jgi:hypothetical protein
MAGSETFAVGRNLSEAKSMFTRATNQNQTREQIAADTLDNIATTGIAPLIEKLYVELHRFDAACVPLDAAIRSMPDTARRQLGGINVAARVAQKYRAAILEAVTGMLPTTGAPRRPDFTAAMDVLKRMHAALDTSSATTAGGGKGRRMFRAVGTVSGISGGLSIEHGELIALVDNPETRKLVQSGALVELDNTMTEGS